MLGSKSPAVVRGGAAAAPDLPCGSTRTLVSARAVCSRARAARAVTADRVPRARRKLQDIGCIPLTEAKIEAEPRLRGRMLDCPTSGRGLARTNPGGVRGWVWPGFR